MQKERFFLVLFISLLLIISIVNAVEINPLSLSGSLCPRETGLFTHVVKNNNNVVKDYSLNIKGSASAWATVVPSGFILGPGEQKNIFTYITPSQSTEPGNYDLQIEASSPGDSKSISHTVTVKNCYSANLGVSSNSKSSCPSDAIQYTVNLKNNGEYAETFSLSVTGNLASRTSLSDNLVILGKGETKNIIVFVNSPADSGSYSLTLIAESESGRVRESVPLLLNVNPCYDFNLAINGNNTYNVCDRSYVVIPLNLKNIGTTVNSYKINVDGPVWAKVEKTDIVLKDKEAKTFNLMFAPDYGSAGEYGIRLTVTPERGSMKSISDFSVTVRKCHSVDVEFLTKKSDSCKGTIESYDAVINNNGEVRKSYRIELDGPPWASIDDKYKLLILGPKEQKKVTIRAAPTSAVKEQNYAVKLKAVATDESSASAKDVDELILNLKDANECYKPAIESKYMDVVVYYDSSVAFPIEVRNDGVRRADFSLFLSGNAAKFSTLNPSAISLDPGKSDIVYLYIAPDINVKLGSYDANIALNIKDGPLLTNKKFNIEITNVKERATNLQSNTEVVKTPVTNEVSYWQRLKSWFGRNFIGSEEERISFSNVTPIINVTNTNTPKFIKYKYYILGVLITILVIILLIIIFSGRKESINKKNKKKSKKTDYEAEDIKGKVEEDN
ncbi:hypothetical protein HYU23_01425 [Candidatus Woesearchaeota archaeon]|nr:hypothetical protein [Candidatus Woesearchaeota archaeon]